MICTCVAAAAVDGSDDSDGVLAVEERADASAQ